MRGDFQVGGAQAGQVFAGEGWWEAWPGRCSPPPIPTGIQINTSGCCRPSSGTRRRRRAKSPAAAGALPAPPARLLTQTGTLQLGRDATLQVELAEQELQQRAERMVNGSSGSVTSAPTNLPAAVQPQSSVVAVPPELSKLLQRPAKQPSVEKEQPAEGQQQQREGKGEQPAEKDDQQAEATAGQQRRRKQRRPDTVSTASDSSSSSSSRKSQRRIIAPKSQGLLAWYDDAVAAAEQAYKQAGRGRPSSAPSLGKALGKPIQVGREWLPFTSAACRRGGLLMVCWCSRHACAPLWSNLNLTHTSTIPPDPLPLPHQPGPHLSAELAG